MALAGIQADGQAKDADIARTLALLNRENLETGVQGVHHRQWTKTLTTFISVPPVMVIDPAGLGIKSLTAKWSMTTSARQSDSLKVGASAEAGVSASYMGIGASFKASSSVDKESKRDSDYTATTEVEMLMERSKPAEGLMKIVDALTENVTGALDLNRMLIEAKVDAAREKIASGEAPDEPAQDKDAEAAPEGGTDAAPESEG